VYGPVHLEPLQIEHDAKRDAWLKAQGIQVLRFSTDELHDRPAAVLATIKAAPPSVNSGDTSPHGFAIGEGPDCNPGAGSQVLPHAGMGEVSPAATEGGSSATTRLTRARYHGACEWQKPGGQPQAPVVPEGTLARGCGAMLRQP